MTDEQAARLLASLAAAFPNQPLPDASQEEYLDHLCALPFDRAEEGVRVGKLTWTFFPRLGELLDAVGVPPSARRDLARAVAARGELLPSLRSTTGWEHVGPDGPIPLGVAEHLTNAGKPLPAGRDVDLTWPALPEARGAPRRLAVLPRPTVLRREERRP